jgi:hypothetical protein
MYQTACTAVSQALFAVNSDPNFCTLFAKSCLKNFSILYAWVDIFIILLELLVA